MPVPNEVFSAISFIAFVLCMIPLYWHMEAWNVGTCMFIFWSGFGTLIFFINSVVWNHNAIDWAPVWCDISTRFITGLAIGIPFSSLTINRRLYKISSVRAVMVTRSERRREMTIDFALALGFPCVVMILQYVVQGHRYNIYEDIGCLPYTWNTPLAYVLVYMWPLWSGLAAGAYCIMTIWNFYKRGRQMREVMSQHSNLNSARYIRLMLLACMELFANIPLTTYIIIQNATMSEVLPWVSWSDTHYGFSKVDVFPRIFWGSDAHANALLELQRWLTVSCALLFVAFFGFADEARRHYRAAYTSLASRLGVSTMSSGTFTDSRFGSRTEKGGLSVHMSTSGPKVKRDSFMSGLSSHISLGEYDSSSYVAKEKDAGPYSPTDSDAASSPTESIASASFAALPTLTADAPPMPAMPEGAVHRPRPESEVIDVERFKGVDAV